jgi:hypothetical protein
MTAGSTISRKTTMYEQALDSVKVETAKGRGPSSVVVFGPDQQ